MVDDGRNQTDSKKQPNDAKNILPGSTTQKLAAGMATIGAMVLLPMQGLLTQMAGSTDFMEIACAPASSLSEAMTSKGYVTKRNQLS